MKQLAIIVAAALSACQQATPDNTNHQEQQPQVVQQSGHSGLEVAGAAVLGMLAGGLLAQRAQQAPQQTPQPVNSPLYTGRQVQEVHLPKPPASAAKPVTAAPVAVPKPVQAAPVVTPPAAPAQKPTQAAAPNYAVKNQGYSAVRQASPTYSRK